jgi:hypothetical protein
MSRSGQSCLLAALLVCVTAPTRSEAAPITFSGTLSQPTEVVALGTLDVTTASLLTVTLTSAFDPILSLFLVDPPSPDDWLTDSDQTDFFSGSHPLLPGRYLLTLSQYPNYFDPVMSAFEVTDPADFLRDFGCYYSASDGTCTDNPTYGGSLSLQAVPEPATLSLVAVGVSAVWCRRRRPQPRAGNRRRCPS